MLEILIHPHQNLRLRATEITTFDAELEKTANLMFETMYKAKGIGLAATQVNIQKRLVVIDIPPERESGEEALGSGKLVLVNPEIIEFSEELSVYEEGCLSLPLQYAEVTRPAWIRYRYQDLQGNWHESSTDGLLATCIQHEIDHLNGILFIDHLSRLKRERLEKKLAKSLKFKDKE